MARCLLQLLDLREGALVEEERQPFAHGQFSLGVLRLGGALAGAAPHALVQCGEFGGAVAQVAVGRCRGVQGRFLDDAHGESVRTVAQDGLDGLWTRGWSGARPGPSTLAS